MRPCLALALVVFVASWSSAPTFWTAHARQPPMEVLELGESEAEAQALAQSESDLQKTTRYSQESAAAIIASGQIPTAVKMGNKTTGNEAKNATLMAQMTDEYLEKLASQDAGKDSKREARENKIQALAGLNKDLDETTKAADAKKRNFTAATILQKKQDFNNFTEMSRRQHFLACEQFKTKNPYPPDSPQFKAVAVACDKENKTASTNPAFGKNDAIFGPSMPTEGFTPTEQAAANKRELQIQMDNAAQQEVEEQIRKQQAQATNYSKLLVANESAANTTAQMGTLLTE